MPRRRQKPAAKKQPCPHCGTKYDGRYLNLHKPKCEKRFLANVMPVKLPKPTMNSAAICFILVYLLGGCGLWTAKLVAYFTIGAMKLSDEAVKVYAVNKGAFESFVDDLDDNPKAVQEKGKVYWAYGKTLYDYFYSNFWCGIANPSRPFAYYGNCFSSSAYHDLEKVEMLLRFHEPRGDDKADERKLYTDRSETDKLDLLVFGVSQMSTIKNQKKAKQLYEAFVIQDSTKTEWAAALAQE